MELLAGLITGVIFGFLLHKGQVVRYEKQVGALIFEDFTIFKFMFSAIIVAMVMLWAFNDLHLITIHPKPLKIVANAVGGLIFGIGWGLLGYCPGTTVCAVGEGRLDGIFGVLGLLAGGYIYAQWYPFFRKLRKIESLGRKSLEDVFRINHWIIIAILIVVMVIMLIWFEKLEKRREVQ